MSHQMTLAQSRSQLAGEEVDNIKISFQIIETTLNLVSNLELEIVLNHLSNFKVSNKQP